MQLLIWENDKQQVVEVERDDLEALLTLVRSLIPPALDPYPNERPGTTK